MLGEEIIEVTVEVLLLVLYAALKKGKELVMHDVGGAKRWKKEH